MSQPTGKYWIYQNRSVSKAKLHLGSCPKCQDGHGQQGARNESLNWWTPYATLEEAESAKLAVKAELEDCKECHPRLAG
jgi:hypothetical protein